MSGHASNAEPQPKRRKVSDGAFVATGGVDYKAMKPFVDDYRPYTRGMGFSFNQDPVAQAQRMWNNYYSQNRTLGFKDRHYLVSEVTELLSAKVVMEIGCGVGNTVFPIIEEVPGLKHYYAFDLSSVAVKMLEGNAAYSKERITSFAHDIATAPLPASVPDGVVDVATMIFVMSAISPDKMPQTVANFASKIAPGGCVYFRDYCEGDLAQKRFSDDALVGDSGKFFMRTCGTCSYFFSKEELIALFAPFFDVRMCETVERSVENKKEDLTMSRVWIHAKFIKR